jgi:hypothetical protein
MPHSTYTGPPATIADMRRIGLSVFVIECAALYCYYQARIEFDALGLPDELSSLDSHQTSALHLHEVRCAKGDDACVLAGLFGARQRGAAA